MAISWPLSPGMPRPLSQELPPALDEGSVSGPFYLRPGKPRTQPGRSPGTVAKHLGTLERASGRRSSKAAISRTMIPTLAKPRTAVRGSYAEAGGSSRFTFSSPGCDGRAWTASPLHHESVDCRRLGTQPARNATNLRLPGRNRAICSPHWLCGGMNWKWKEYSSRRSCMVLPDQNRVLSMPARTRPVNLQSKVCGSCEKPPASLA